MIRRLFVGPIEGYYPTKKVEHEQGIVAEARKAAEKARDLGWMITIWVVQGQLWQVVADC